MVKTLFINACVRPDSRTLELAKHVLDKISGEVEEVKLYKENLSPIDLIEMEIRDKAVQTNDFSNEVFNLAKQFANAESIVVAAPYWDLMFPAVVKSYFEKVTVNGVTFTYGDNGTINGKCKAKRLVYVTTAGGTIKYNFGYQYIEALAKNFYGINQVCLVKAEGLDVCGTDVSMLMQQAKNTFKI